MRSIGRSLRAVVLDLLRLNPASGIFLQCEAIVGRWQVAKIIGFADLPSQTLPKAAVLYEPK